MDKSFYGNYKGFVLDNVDPEHAGRVKVWVPSIHGRNFNLFDEDAEDIIGGLSRSEIEDFNAKLPWADVAQSLVGGGGGSAIYNGNELNVGDGVQETQSVNAQTTEAEQNIQEPITQTQKPAQAFAPSNSNFSVTNDTRDQMGGSSQVRKRGRPISLDFNSAGGNAGIFIVAPSDITPEENALCLEYVRAVSNFFDRYSKDPKSKKISSNPVRIKGVTNKRGINGFFHTEPFDQDGAAMDAIIQNPQEFANILASTLGKIRNALFFPPHETNGGGGAVFKPNSFSAGINERDFARQYIIPYLTGANGSLTIDAFSSVGNKHPEEARDEEVLKELNIPQNKIDEITENGKSIHLTKKRAKSDNSGRFSGILDNLRNLRDKLWDDLPLTNQEDIQKRNEYISRYNSNRDYSDKPLSSKVNPAAQSYGHTVYNNVSKGSFTIPDVGSKVWVFFAEGEIESPVVFANNPDAQDYAGIFGVGSNSPDYPVEKIDDEQDINRGKYVMNNRGGSFEIVETTGNETIKITSYQGNTYEMNKLGVTEFVVGNKSQLVRGDIFKTVRGDTLSYTGKNKEDIVKGDVTEKYGNIRDNVDVAKRIKDLYKPIHDKARLFDVKRTEAGHPLDTSPLQTKSGENTPCPTCSGEHTFTTRTSTPTTYTDSNARGSGRRERINSGESKIEQRHEDSSSCLSCGGSGVSKWSAEGKFDKEPLKEEIVTDINNSYDEMTRLENELGDGGNKTTYISKSHVVHIGSVMNDLESIRVDPNGKRVLIGQVPSENGKVVAPQYDSAPHVEKVATNDLAGGDFFMSVANKYDLIVGANGARIKSLGECSLQGRIVTVSGEQVIISSNNQIKFDGGKNLELKADSITISPRTKSNNGKDQKSIALDGTVSISNNMVVKGGAHVEGEFSAQHITAPLEIQETETSLSYSNLIAGKVIGITSDGKTVRSVAATDFAVSSHSHPFANIPLTLVPTNDDVRSNAHDMALAQPVLAQPVDNRKSRLKTYASIRYFNPELFALFEDCDDTEHEQLMDDLYYGRKTVEEIQDQLTRASQSSIASGSDGVKDCEVDRTDLNTPKN